MLSRRRTRVLCTRCHGTGKVLMACWERGGRIRMRTKRCPFH